MNESTFRLPKMDCPSEERMVRLALDGNSEVKRMSFDLAGRSVTILHENEASAIVALLEPVGLGVQLLDSRETNDSAAIGPANQDVSDIDERSALKKVLAVNASMFVVEIVAGLYAQSTGLLADSLDNFADASVFALSLYAVGQTLGHKKRAARISGYLQGTLALGAFVEVARKFVFGSEAIGSVMIVTALVALGANAYCMKVLANQRDKEVHMRASWIFLTNDIIANIGVIVAGGLVTLIGSSIPDLVVGAIIASVVLLGSIRILRAAR